MGSPMHVAYTFGGKKTKADFSYSVFLKNMDNWNKSLGTTSFFDKFTSYNDVTILSIEQKNESYFFMLNILEK